MVDKKTGKGGEAVRRRRPGLISKQEENSPSGNPGAEDSDGSYNPPQQRKHKSSGNTGLEDSDGPPQPWKHKRLGNIGLEDSDGKADSAANPYNQGFDMSHLGHPSFGVSNVSLKHNAPEPYYPMNLAKEHEWQQNHSEVQNYITSKPGMLPFPSPQPDIPE